MSTNPTTTKRAFAALTAGPRVSEYAYEPKPLGEKDVAIDVTHCGMCHSDVHTIENEWSGQGASTTYPIVVGHEAVGRIVATGAAVTELKVGDVVGVGAQRGACLTCEFCLKGDEQLCWGWQGTYGHGFTGGYSEHLRCHERFVFKLPDGMDPARAAPLLCAGATTFSPLAYYKPAAGATVGVVGIGGLGHLALQYAAAMGYRVVAISGSPNKEAEARSFGATSFLNSSDADAFKAAAGSIDFLIVTVSATLDWGAYLRLLRQNGRMCLLGAPAEPIKLNAFDLIFGRKSIVTSLIGGTTDIKAMLEFSHKHNIYPQIEKVPVRFDEPDKVNDAIRRMLANDVRYRFVLEYQV